MLQVPARAIAIDLQRTGSVDATTANILDGRVAIPLDQNQPRLHIHPIVQPPQANESPNHSGRMSAQAMTPQAMSVLSRRLARITNRTRMATPVTQTQQTPHTSLRANSTHSPVLPHGPFTNQPTSVQYLGHGKCELKYLVCTNTTS